MQQDDLFDVAIVGYGPTGATLANLLALSGLRVVVLEREAEIYHLPRAVHFDGECMRVFQTVGIADDLSRKVRINPGMRFVDPAGDLIMDWPRPQEIGPMGWHASFRLHQPDLEKLLRDKLSTYETARVLAHSEVTDLTDTGEIVELTYRHRGDGSSRQLKAQFVVGCDGARSMVRGAIGSGMEDLGFEERWLVIDVLLKRPRPDLGDHSVQFCNPDRPMTYCRSPETRRRWEITVLEDETDAEVTAPDRIWEFLSPWIGPEDADLERSAVYTFRSAIAETWRKGRIMVAGDAAHLTPPFMGQGMCAGIRDAANLGWKLALCAQGQAGLELLDSYQEERSPNVRAFISTAVKLGGLINSLDRETALKMGSEGAGGETRIKTIAPPLGRSDLGGLVDPDGAHCGQLFSQPMLRDGHKLDDVAGYAPALITRHPMPGDPSTSFRVFDAETHPELASALDGFDCDAALVRPDRYIAGTAVTVGEVADLIASPLPLVP